MKKGFCVGIAAAAAARKAENCDGGGKNAAGAAAPAVAPALEEVCVVGETRIEWCAECCG